MAGDANFSNRVLLLHCDGTNGSTTFTDVKGKSPTATNAVLTTSDFKFGTASASFNGTSAYISVATSSDWNFGTGDFTIQMFVKPTNFALVSGANQCYLSCGTSNYAILVDTSGHLLWFSGSTLLTSTATLTAGSWNYIAISRSGTTLTVAAGLSGSTTSNSTSNSTNYTSANALILGASSVSTGYFNGLMDEVRVTKGYADSIGTVPTSAFPDTADPQLDNTCTSKLISTADSLAITTPIYQLYL
jgi:hypothetical protein